MSIDFSPILNSIEIMLDEAMDKLPFNRKIEGVIVDSLANDQYRVRIQGELETIDSMNEYTYQIGDVVYILIFNNNYSDKKILCKR